MKENKTMPENEPTKILFDCHIKGLYQRLTWKDIFEFLTTCNLFWPVPYDQYGWNIDGFKGCNDVCENTGTIPMCVGLKVHTQRAPYTLEQAQTDFKTGNLIEDRMLFISWAAKFHSIFRSNETKIIKTINGQKIHRKKLALPKNCWPLIHLKVPMGLGPVVWHAYKLNSKLKIMVIDGVTKESGYSNADIPWNKLMEHFLSRND